MNRWLGFMAVVAAGGCVENGYYAFATVSALFAIAFYMYDIGKRITDCIALTKK